MEKNIKDYLPFYLGCKCRHRYIDHEDGLWTIWYTLDAKDLYLLLNDASIDDIQIQCRPLSDMTEEEKNDFELWSYEIMKEDLNQVQRNALKTNWYLNKHFDLFGLIKTGLAIDKTTLKQ